MTDSLTETNLLTGKRLLVTGIATSSSVACATASRARAHGATVVATAMPRDLEGARAAVREIGGDIEVLALDATSPDDLAAVSAWVVDELGGLDGALHAIAYAPKVALESIFDVPTDAIELAFRTSVHTYVSLGRLLADLAPPSGASLVGLGFAADRAWPTYNWMGVCKSALESVNGYLARDLGPEQVRVNLVAAGPLETRAASAIPGFDLLLDSWTTRSALPWDPTDPGPVADAVCFLLSDLARGITGGTIHVDGGHHAMA